MNQAHHPSEISGSYHAGEARDILETKNKTETTIPMANTTTGNF